MQQTNHLPPEEDSLDAEDIFDLEGMDSRNNMISDQEEDYDDSDGKNNSFENTNHNLIIGNSLHNQNYARA